MYIPSVASRPFAPVHRVGRNLGPSNGWDRLGPLDVVFSAGVHVTFAQRTDPGLLGPVGSYCPRIRRGGVALILVSTPVRRVRGEGSSRKLAGGK